MRSTDCTNRGSKTTWSSSWSWRGFRVFSLSSQWTCIIPNVDCASIIDCSHRDVRVRERESDTMQQLIWAQHQAGCRGLGSPTTLDRSEHKSAMPGKKQADIDTPLGTWSVRNSVITIMGITITAASSLLQGRS